MDVCPLSNEQLQETLVYSLQQQCPAIYKLDTGATKYHPPNFLSSESKVPHYRLMKIWQSMHSSTITADSVWWMNRLLVKGVPQAAWMGAILASAQDLLWKSFDIWVSCPSFVHSKAPLTLAQGCLQWCQCLMNIKQKYMRALQHYAELDPQLIWTNLEPVSSHAAFAQANKAASSYDDAPTLPIEDPIVDN